MSYGSYYTPDLLMAQEETVLSIILIALLVFLFAFLAFMLLFYVVIYVSSSISIMKICKKLSIDKAYLAFVPFANSFKLGQIADVLCQKNGETKLGHAKKLLIMHIVSAASAFLFAIPYAVLTTALEFLKAGPILIAIFIALAVCYLVFLAVEIITLVFAYIAHWKIFKYTNEKTAVLFLVLSILLGSWPFLLIIAFSKKPIPEPYAEAEIPETI